MSVTRCYYTAFPACDFKKQKNVLDDLFQCFYNKTY